jgi:hypothetical protein
MSHVANGRPHPESWKREREYLLKKLEEVRKDCQWLLGLAAASVFGVMIKDNFGATMPQLRMTTLIISVLQILVSMLGAMSWWAARVDPSDEVNFLSGRLSIRFLLRNVSILLLALSFILIAVMGWSTLSSSK